MLVWRKSGSKFQVGYYAPPTYRDVQAPQVSEVWAWMVLGEFDVEGDAVLWVHYLNGGSSTDKWPTAVEAPAPI